MSKVICPSCGAENDVTSAEGMDCPFCGTHLELSTQQKAVKENSASPFSWQNVCPTGWDLKKEDVIGDVYKSQYMVVKKKTRDSVESYEGEVYTYSDYIYAIINREGKFAIDPTGAKIRLFADSGDCCVEYVGAFNLASGKISSINIFMNGNLDSDYHFIILNNENTKCIGIYDVLNKKNIEFDQPVPYSTKFKKINDDGTLHGWNGSFSKLEEYTIKVKEGKGIVTCECFRCRGYVDDWYILSNGSKSCWGLRKLLTATIRFNQPVKVYSLNHNKDFEVWRGAEDDGRKFTIKIEGNIGTVSFEKEDSGGCYVATAVYGSYDCPEVWTLRRFRDYFLAETVAGRLFIKTYYATSPTLVRLYGDTSWFHSVVKPILDKMVKTLQSHGYESTQYNDKKW